MSYNLTDVKDDYGLIASGEYEAVLEKVELKQYSTGTEYINLQYRIRTDFDQEHQNRVMFDKILKEKGTNIFNRQRLTRILKACIPEDTPLNFGSLDDILDTIVGKKVRIVVSQRYNDFFDEDENFIHYYKPTKEPDKELGKPEVESTTSSDVIDDIDDLPF